MNKSSIAEMLFIGFVCLMIGLFIGLESSPDNYDIDLSNQLEEMTINEVRKNSNHFGYSWRIKAFWLGPVIMISAGHGNRKFSIKVSTRKLDNLMNERREELKLNGETAYSISYTDIKEGLRPLAKEIAQNIVLAQS